MKRGDLVILLRFRSARALDLPQPGSIGIILNAGVTSFEEMVPAGYIPVLMAGRHQRILAKHLKVISEAG
jgi:hypothetical protein